MDCTSLSPLGGKRRRRKRIRDYHRRWTYRQHQGICFLCGEPVPFADATIDHWIPLAHGGRHSRHNFALAHSKCNNQKGNLVPADEEIVRADRELTEIRKRYRM